MITTDRPTTTATLWVCSDCATTEASGRLPEHYYEDGRSPDPRQPEPWSALGDVQVHATPGLIADEHDDDCANYGYAPCPAGCDDGYVDEGASGRVCETCHGDGHGPRMDGRDADDDCEAIGFSWRPCDGCGSSLGGDRYGYTLHGVHVGHFSRLGGTYWCDTCDSPYCENA